jgi:hypothetical protein
MAAKHNQLQKKILRAMKADPKKTAVLTVLVTVLGMMWVRMAMRQKDTPALAATAMSYQVPDSRPRQFPEDQASANSKWLHGPINELRPLSRNLFAVKLDNFPLDGTGPAPEAAKETNDGFWDQLAKSMSSRADLKKERAALLDNLQQQAGQLKLQSIVMGAKPRAVVNGEMVREGDNLTTGMGESRTMFRVLKIESRRIIIEREGIKLEVQMN